MEINYLMQKFWWGHKENESKIHWMSWKKLGFSKTLGGSGFKDLRCFNIALLAKQGWRLLQNPTNLAGRILRTKYFPRGNFLGASLRRKPSFAWRNIFSSNDLTMEGLIWRIGDGSNVHIWGEKWLPTLTTHADQSLPKILPENPKVSDLIDPDTKWWNRSLIQAIF
jgi:hypothetical protein